MSHLIHTALPPDSATLSQTKRPSGDQQKRNMRKAHRSAQGALTASFSELEERLTVLKAKLAKLHKAAHSSHN